MIACFFPKKGDLVVKSFRRYLTYQKLKVQMGYILQLETTISSSFYRNDKYAIGFHMQEGAFKDEQ